MWMTMTQPWCILMYGVHERKILTKVSSDEMAVPSATGDARSSGSTVMRSGRSVRSVSPTGGSAPLSAPGCSDDGSTDIANTECPRGCGCGASSPRLNGPLSAKAKTAADTAMWSTAICPRWGDSRVSVARSRVK